MEQEWDQMIEDLEEELQRPPTPEEFWKAWEELERQWSDAYEYMEENNDPFDKHY